MIDGPAIKRLRERRGWSQNDLAAALNAALEGRNYSSGSISPWETGKRTIPPDVGAFIEELMIDTNLPPDAGEQDEPPAGADTPPGSDLPPGDTPPGPGPGPGQPPIGGSGAWTRACTELWELIATGVGMAGAATGNETVMQDGAIIAADAPALGAAWAKLAETNETFRKMLLGMTEGGAWLQVALVTGTTVSKCYQNHAVRALQPAPGGDNGAGTVTAVA